MSDIQEPVAWRVKDYADGWTLHHTLNAAEREALRQWYPPSMNGNLIQPLYSAPPPVVPVEPAIPPGFMVVPEEPTEEMMEAAIAKYEATCQHRYSAASLSLAIKAAIAARPPLCAAIPPGYVLTGLTPREREILSSFWGASLALLSKSELSK